MKKINLFSFAAILFLASCQQQADRVTEQETNAGNPFVVVEPEQTPTTATPLARTQEFHRYFNTPENRVKIQFPTPESQYAWQHATRYYPTTRSARDGEISNFKVKINNAIGDITFSGKDGVVRSVSQHFEEMPLDAMVVVHKGNIVYERYKTMEPKTAHLTMSCSKVFSSTIIAMLEDEGKIDLSKPVTDYIPELKGSVWETVPVRHVADMQTGLNATEHDEATPDSRTNPDQPFYQWMSTLGLVPNTTGLDDPYQAMVKMKRNKPGGQVFEYNSMNPFLLARIVEKIEDRPFADVFSDRIWGKIGAEHDATFVVSPQGYALAYGFTSVTLRDFARFGALFTPSAKIVSKETIISPNTVQRIQKAGNPSAFPGGYVGREMTPKFSDDAGKISNAYMWDAIMSDGDMFKAGVGGQGLYVSPSRDLVIVWFATGTGGEWSEAMGRAIALSMSTSNNNQKNLTMATSIEENRPQGSEPESIFKGMLDHVCIRVVDIDLSIEFYRKAFGYKVKGRWDGQTIGEGENAKTVPGIGAMIEDEAGGVIELILDQNTGDRQANQRPINHFAIRVNEVETGYKQALEAGAVSIMPPTTISTKISKLKTAFVFGPDGERIEIINYDNQ